MPPEEYYGKVEYKLQVDNPNLDTFQHRVT
jgi:hypothetical protein